MVAEKNKQTSLAMRMGCFFILNVKNKIYFFIMALSTSIKMGVL